MQIWQKFKRRKFDVSKSPTLVIPTRNRPTSLNCVLQYLTCFYPNARVIVADGSDKPFQSINEENARAAGETLELSYKAFAADLSLLDRLEAVISAEPEGYYILGADDDFPILETLSKAKAFLEADSSYNVCGGYNQLIKMGANNNWSTLMFDARSIEHESASLRCRAYADHDFPTYYCVTSRSHILSRYDRCRESFIVGFVDYMLGFHDLCKGKLKVLNDLSYIRTSNSTHSYVRVTDRLNFLRQSDKILTLKERIAEELLSADNDISDEQAQHLSEDFIFERIRFLTRDRTNKDPFIEEAQNFQAALKDETSAEFKKYDERMKFVRDKLKEIVHSDDNKFESRFRPTMDGR